ncbi:imm11 family protein [Aliikangiella sp. G2MR2-5]|uniref:imm11 family protein n=1 Tax=Aliikangiella sp. G2MR2-5 TaxID=2788943 RepID=UPI0018A9BE2D|nr:DUF1629 domain-containing protein [Aliikangiella sp. G2MR2-5]
MNKYYLLESSCYVDYGITKSPKLGAESVFAGRLLKRDNLPPLIFEHNFPGNETIPGLLVDSAVLVSQFFVDTLKIANVDNFQIFPVTLINPETNEERKDYFLFNVIGLMKVTNMERSDYDEIMPGNPETGMLPLVAFNKIVIDGKKTQDVSMFRLAEDPRSIIISESIVKALKSNKPSGGWGVIIEELELY